MARARAWGVLLGFVQAHAVRHQPPATVWGVVAPSSTPDEAHGVSGAYLIPHAFHLPAQQPEKLPIARKLGEDVKFVHGTVSRYNAQGPGALENARRGKEFRQKRLLTVEQE